MTPLLRRFAVLLALLLSAPAGAGDDSAKVAAAAVRARNLAGRLQEALDPDQRGRVTMAVGILDDGKVIIGTSEDDNRLRSPVRAIKDAEDADLADVMRKGHAEEKIVAHVQGSLFFYRNRRILVIAAGIPICERCERTILAAGARPASRCRSGRTY